MKAFAAAVWRGIRSSYLKRVCLWNCFVDIATIANHASLQELYLIGSRCLISSTDDQKGSTTIAIDLPRLARLLLNGNAPIQSLLISLHPNGTTHSQSQLSILLETIASHKTLQELQYQGIGRNRCCSLTAVQVAAHVPKLANLQKLRLDMHGDYLKNNILANMLSKVMHHNQSIESLALLHIDDQGLALVVDGLMKCPNLRDLKLDYANLTQVSEESVCVLLQYGGLRALHIHVVVATGAGDYLRLTPRLVSQVARSLTLDMLTLKATDQQGLGNLYMTATPQLHQRLDGYLCGNRALVSCDPHQHSLWPLACQTMKDASPRGDVCVCLQD